MAHFILLKIKLELHLKQQQAKLKSSRMFFYVRQQSVKSKRNTQRYTTKYNMNYLLHGLSQHTAKALCIYIYNQSLLHCITCPLLYRSKEIIYVTIKGKRSKPNFGRKRKRTDLKDKLKGNNTQRPKEIKMLKRKINKKKNNNIPKIEHLHFGQVVIFLIVLRVSNTCRTVEGFL